MKGIVLCKKYILFVIIQEEDSYDENSEQMNILVI